MPDIYGGGCIDRNRKCVCRNTFCILIAEKIRGVDEISNIKNFPGVNDFNKWY